MDKMKSLKKLLTDDWLVKLLCLLLAIGFWFVVHQSNKQENSPYQNAPIRSHP